MPDEQRGVAAMRVAGNADPQAGAGRHRCRSCNTATSGTCVLSYSASPSSRLGNQRGAQAPSTPSTSTLGGLRRLPATAASARMPWALPRIDQPRACERPREPPRAAESPGQPMIPSSTLASPLRANALLAGAYHLCRLVSSILTPATIIVTWVAHAIAAALGRRVAAAPATGHLALSTAAIARVT